MFVMAVLHDRAVRHEIEQRVRSLRSDSRGRWGKMAVDQMLWHCNQALDMALGDFTPPASRKPLPGVVLKFLVLRLPWMKGAPTHPAIVAKATYDFTEQQARCLELIEAMASKPIDGAWPHHPTFGHMRGAEVSQLMAKHLDHHLRQFGV